MQRRRDRKFAAALHATPDERSERHSRDRSTQANQERLVLHFLQ